MKHFLIVNGLDHAFLREFGCPCKRCVGQRTAVNTSISLVSLDDNGDRILHHVLFDIGMSVVDSLIDSPFLSGNKARLDWLVISHWHPDHVLDLNRLCETWRRTLKQRGESWKPIATWCRSGTAIWLKVNHGYESSNFLDVRVSNEFNPIGTVLEPIPIELSDLTVIPITVSHCTADISPSKGVLPCCASFVVQRKGGKKAVLLWDIDNRNGWIKNLTSDEQKESVKLLSRADYLFIDCNTWSIEEVNGKNTGHASFSTVQRYAKVLSPKVTFLVHLSGHEDREGNLGWGWDDQTWEKNAQRVWQARGLPGEVRVPQIGEKFEI